MPIVNIAFQILPIVNSKEEMYAMVDKAIEVIAQSGLKYEVCPFETVMEGEYDEVMTTIKKAQEACMEAGVEEILSYIKIQQSKASNVSIEDKMENYRKTPSSN